MEMVVQQSVNTIKIQAFPDGLLIWVHSRQWLEKRFPVLWVALNFVWSCNKETAPSCPLWSWKRRYPAKKASVTTQARIDVFSIMLAEVWLIRFLPGPFHPTEFFNRQMFIKVREVNLDKISVILTKELDRVEKVCNLCEIWSWQQRSEKVLEVLWDTSYVLLRYTVPRKWNLDFHIHDCNKKQEDSVSV